MINIKIISDGREKMDFGSRLRVVGAKYILSTIMERTLPTKGTFRVEGGAPPFEKISLGTPPSPPSRRFSGP